MQPPLHTIRLAGPWEFRVGNEAEWRTIKVPAEWRAILQALALEGIAVTQPSHFRGAKGDCSARRRFQRPTGLDGGLTVWIVLRTTEESVKVLSINDSEKLTAYQRHPQGVAFDVTDSLQTTNVLTIEFDIEWLITDDASGSMFDGALLEIRTSDVAE